MSTHNGQYGGASDGRREHRAKITRASANEEMAASIRDKLAMIEGNKKKAADAAEAIEKTHREALRKRVQEEAVKASRARKVLVCGDVRGGFAKLFTTVEAQSSKVGAFDVLFCAGGTLPDAAAIAAAVAADGNGQSSGSTMAPYLSGEAKVPVETYFVDADAALLQASPRGRMLCGNMCFLGGYGVRELCGLRVAYLSGRYDPAVYDNPDVDFIGGSFTVRAITELQRLVVEDKRHRGIDLLLTCGWPFGLDQRLDEEGQRPVDLDDGHPWRQACAPPLAKLCLAVEPRYHIFSGADLFYQRPPFQTPIREHMCRCIGLGTVGSVSKQRKWLHALSLSPMAHMKKADLKQLPGNVTPCPFLTPLGQKCVVTDATAYGAPAAKRLKVEGAQYGTEITDVERSFAEHALTALLAGHICEYQKAVGELHALRLCIPAALKPKAQELEKESNHESRKLSAGSAGIGVIAGAGKFGVEIPPTLDKSCIHEKFHEKPEENRLSSDAERDEAALIWLASTPGEGSVRYTFKDHESLGLRLSRDVPPWILEVRDGSLGAKKAPRVPVGAVVLAINGYEINRQDDPIVAMSLKGRPVVLDIEWPLDQGKPIVNRA